MNKFTVFSGCAAAVLLAAGCGPELAQGDYGPEEQQWQQVISSSYSGHRPPRIAPPAIVDRASREALEKQRAQQNIAETAQEKEAVSEVPAPEGDKDSAPAVKEVSPAAAVDAAAEKKDDAAVKPAENADKKNEPAKKETEKKADEKNAKTDAAQKAKAAPADQQDLEYEIYVVKSGDNPGSIAQKYYGKASYAGLIMKANPEIKDARQIQIGTKLKIPKL